MLQWEEGSYVMSDFAIPMGISGFLAPTLGHRPRQALHLCKRIQTFEGDD